MQLFICVGVLNKGTMYGTEENVEPRLIYGFGLSHYYLVAASNGRSGRNAADRVTRLTEIRVSIKSTRKADLALYRTNL